VQCKNGHLACGGCRARQCRKCKNNGGGSFEARNAVVEDIISVSKFKCPHSGCHGFFPYPDLRAHRGACHHAPCFCAEPGCTFAAPPPRLLRHLAADHSWPAQGVAYGKAVRLRVPLSEPRRLLLAEEDGRVFALIVGALGAVTAVSVVCVRAADCAPRYTAALRAGSTSMVAMETVTSSDRPGEVSVEKLPCVLTVPPTSLSDGAVTLKIRIEKILA
jgi:E3 ubiquitin-protein ligase SIAH1